MTLKKILISFVALLSFSSCSVNSSVSSKGDSFNWQAANLYFVLPDRFSNGDLTNDKSFGRTESTAAYRGFEGGDLRGMIQKLDQGYFTNLGINAIWLTPLVEQIHGAVDEGTGLTYPYHGYWAKDWTSLDPNFGSKADLKEFVEKAHKRGIRIVLDAVINHTGPVTSTDPVFPTSWVRTEPICTYENYHSTVSCTLVENLPDLLTESTLPVELPASLVEKWKKENRYEKEVAELDAFFEKTGYPRAPKYYVMKWLSDYIKEYGIDGYRVDTVKHTEEGVWKDFEKVAKSAFLEYKAANPTKVLDQKDFFLVGEVYGYGISQEKQYDFSDRKVNYFDNGFDALINFDFKSDANKEYEDLFHYYDQMLSGPLKGKTVMNYVTSHDDSTPFDKERNRGFESATKLLLTPGIAQIYYGDESGRSLILEGAVGDATLRGTMNWEEIQSSPSTQELLAHYQKLGKFRAQHPAIGAGKHQMLSKSPYYFSRVLDKDKVIVGLSLSPGRKQVDVKGVFAEGAALTDAYSGASAKVKNGQVSFNSPEEIVLLELKK
ncbi:alpha-amylase family glycosyl hydrolase [Chryseobacterium sp. A301]